MDLKKYEKFLTSDRWSTKDSKYAQVLALVEVSQKLIDDPKKNSEKSNMEYTNLETSYIKDIPYWTMEYMKWGIGHKTNTVIKSYTMC